MKQRSEGGDRRNLKCGGQVGRECRQKVCDLWRPPSDLSHAVALGLNFQEPSCRFRSIKLFFRRTLDGWFLPGHADCPAILYNRVAQRYSSMCSSSPANGQEDSDN